MVSSTGKEILDVQRLNKPNIVPQQDGFDVLSFARYGMSGEETPAVVADDAVFDLRPITAEIDGRFFARNGIPEARAAIAAGSLPRLDVNGLRLGPPIARPGKIVCIGLNYRDHAAETGAAIPEEPIVFMKDPSTLVSPLDDILIPRGSSKTDWEVELGVVIGRTARYLESPEAAAEVIAGYGISHDVSERAFQLERGGQWDKGKSCESFNPFGPILVPVEDLDEEPLRLQLRVNGELRQNGSTADMVFDVPYLIWYLSQFMVLHPGDLINTGTPAGVALGLPDNPFLRPGDVVELSIEKLGVARQRLVEA